MIKTFEYELTKAAYLMATEMFRLQPGETFVITADTQSDMLVVNAVAAAAHTVGAKPMVITLAAPLGVGKAADPMLPVKALTGALKEADACKKRRIRDKERRIQQAKEEKRRWEAEKQRRKEEERIQRLEMQVESWRKSRHIRDFLKAAAELVTQKHGGYEEESEFGQWLKWAQDYADRIDPLAG